MQNGQVMQSEIFRDMSEGLLYLDLKGVIRMVNPAAEEILDAEAPLLMGNTFAKYFFQENPSAENDDFLQLVMDAVYQQSRTHRGVVLYDTGSRKKWLRVTSSFLTEDGEKRGVILVFSDVTELVALRDENRRMAEEAMAALHSFVRVMVAAVDARSPYNANHTRNMVRCAERFLDWAAENNRPLGDLPRDPFLISVWVHDIGKLGIPLEIMDKPTRLGSLEDSLRARLQTARLMERIQALEEPAYAEEAARKTAAYDEAESFLIACSNAGFLTDEKLEGVRKAAALTCLTAEGETIPLLTEEEVEALSIRKGTLTDGERKVIQSHVELTAKMLDQMRLPEMYAQVPGWASAHHEFLDGTGYPRHLAGEDVPRAARLLTILDIFDALTARDRPYKKAIPLPKALSILESMRDEGKLDGEILGEFIQSAAWEALQEGDGDP